MAQIIITLLCTVLLLIYINLTRRNIILATREDLDNAITELENELGTVVADINAKNEAAGNPIDLSPEIGRLQALTSTLKSIDPGPITTGTEANPPTGDGTDANPPA